MNRYDRFMELYEHYYDKATDIVRKKVNSNIGYIDGVEFEDDTIEVTWYIPSGCGCCPGEREYYTIKKEELYSPEEERKEKLNIILKK